MTKKIELGQFFTKKSTWLKPHVQAFIDSIKFDKIIDPFAGGGHLLKVFDSQYQTAGYDIDDKLMWPINDGLVSIPLHHNDLCITNPPYLNKGTAKRFNRIGIMHYFEKFPEFDDLYLMGLEQCLNSFDYGIAIIPETYQLHPKKSNRIRSLTVLEENPFDDTDFPVILIIWGPDSRNDYDIYKNDTFIGTFNTLSTKIPVSQKVKQNVIKFNDVNGNLGVICIDKGDLIGGIKFTGPEDIRGEIKHSSRTSTKIMIHTTVNIAQLIIECNALLAQYREDTHDVFLAPFKGNDTQGARRRRLDFGTIRLILENALVKLDPLISKKEFKKIKSKETKRSLLLEELFEEI